MDSAAFVTVDDARVCVCRCDAGDPDQRPVPGAADRRRHQRQHRRQRLQQPARPLPPLMVILPQPPSVLFLPSHRKPACSSLALESGRCFLWFWGGTVRLILAFCLYRGSGRGCIDASASMIWITV
jgi:hypothetical protein